MENKVRSTKVLVIGAGPAGLTAAYILAKNGAQVEVIEADSQYVGGLSRTIKHNGFHFDIGGHRFFSKFKEVEDFWHEILPNDFLIRKRSSRIFYRQRFFTYPLRAFEAFHKLGPIESVLCVASYVQFKIFPRTPVRSFEDWVSNRFGKRLFKTFFKTYTEKVWGMKCSEISADWAAQRIAGFSLWQAIKNALSQLSSNKSKKIRTLIQSFHYPRKGPGMLWEECAKKLVEAGGTIRMGTTVQNFTRNGDSWNVELQTGAKHDHAIVEHIISSAPIGNLVRWYKDGFSENTHAAADALKHRDFITVVLMFKGKDLFEDNWIYIHEPGVRVGRVQNYKSWSPEMVPGPEWCCYGLEYFCFEGDGLWSRSNEELLNLAESEMKKIGFYISAEISGFIIRQPKAYPVYDENYARHLNTIRAELEGKPTLHPVGRNGMHQYNNQDHAVMSAMLTAQNILAGKCVHDVWKLNDNNENFETMSVDRPSISVNRAVPRRKITSTQ